MKKNSIIVPIYPVADKNKKNFATFENSSPWKKSKVSFNWVNFEYPSMHSHDHWELFFLLSGSILHTINNTSYIMQKGNACLVRPNDRHNFTFVDKNHSNFCQHINFLIENDYAMQIFNNYENNFAQKIMDEYDFLPFNVEQAKINSIAGKCLTLQSLNISMEDKIFQCKIIVNELINIFLKQKYFFANAYPDWMKSLLIILNNPNLHNMQMAELAKSTPYSYSRLSRIFKKLTGLTIVEYITSVKMNYAKELLKSTDMTTLKISSELNYESLSHFNHTFKKYYNVTPKAYRNH